MKYCYVLNYSNLIDGIIIDYMINNIWDYYFF